MVFMYVKKISVITVLTLFKLWMYNHILKKQNTFESFSKNWNNFFPNIYLSPFECHWNSKIKYKIEAPNNFSPTESRECTVHTKTPHYRALYVFQLIKARTVAFAFSVYSVHWTVYTVLWISEAEWMRSSWVVRTYDCQCRSHSQ